MILSPQAQIEANLETSLVSAPPAVRHALLNQKTHVLDQPILAWRKEYETSATARYRLYQAISDAMMLNPHPMYGRHNPNRPHLVDIAAGKIRPVDYRSMTHRFGLPGTMPLRDNHFFDGAKKSIVSKVMGQPFDFSVRNTSADFAKQSLLDDAKKSARLFTEAVVRSMVAGGDGSVAPLSDPRIDLPKTAADWLSFATGVEQLEGTLFDLLQDVDARCSFREIERQCASHKFDINAETAYVEVRNSRVHVRALDPHQVRYLAGRPVERFTDPAVMAVQFSEYMTFSELVNRYGSGFLMDGTGIKGVQAFFDSISKPGSASAFYDPQATYLTEFGYSNQWTNDNTPVPMYRNWINQLFYPSAGGTRNLMRQILVQPNFFVMQREKRFLVEKIEYGTRSACTEREFQRYKANRSMVNFELDFTPLDERDGPRGLIKVYTRPELWSFLRVGHASYFDDGPYRYQPDFDTDVRERDRIPWPIVQRTSWQKSMTLLGENDAVQANFLYQKVNELMAQIGIEEVLIIDDAQGKDAVSYLYNAKQSGVLKIDSTKYDRGNPAANKHLSTVRLSNNTDQLAVLLTMIRNLQRGFEVRVGAGPDVQGQANPYQSGKQQQMNLAGQELLNVEFLWEHHQFMNELLQTTVDVCKFYYAKEADMIAVVGDRQHKLLKLTSDLAAADVGIHLESGQQLADRRDMLRRMVEAMAASGGIEHIEALAAIITNNNPAKGLAELRRIKQEIAKQQEAAQENGLRVAQEQAKAQQQQFENDMAIEKERTNRAILVAQEETSRYLRGKGIDVEADAARMAQESAQEPAGQPA